MPRSSVRQLGLVLALALGAFVAAAAYGAASEAPAPSAFGDSVVRHVVGGPAALQARPDSGRDGTTLLRNGERRVQLLVAALGLGAWFAWATGKRAALDADRGSWRLRSRALASSRAPPPRY